VESRYVTAEPVCAGLELDFKILERFISTLSDHSSATMSFDVYAGVKPDLLRAAAEAAANGVKKAVSDAASGAGVENQTSRNDAAVVSFVQHACKGEKWWAILDSNQ
jgi:hypothetical protein